MEYAIASTILITIVALAIAATNFKGIGANAAFGIKTNGSRIVVPPMTP